MTEHRQTIGFLGVGHLASHLVPGLLGAGTAPAILLSARNAETSATLAKRFDLEICASNTDLVARSDIVLLAVRPFQVEQAIAGLPWRPDQLLVSLCAGVTLETMAQHAKPATLARAMPVIAGEYGESATCLYPDINAARTLLERLGPVTAMGSEDEFEAASVCGALFGWVQAQIGDLSDWLADAGVAPDAARAMITQTFRAAATTLRETPDTPIADLVDELCLPESITGLGLRTLEAHDAFTGWRAAGDAVLAKLHGKDNEAS